MVIDPSTVFINRPTPTEVEVRVNFGMLAGREATPAELDELATELLPLLDTVSIVAEHRQETDGHGETELHQVRIDLTEEDPVDDVAAVALLWAAACFDARHAEVSEI